MCERSIELEIKLERLATISSESAIITLKRRRYLYILSKENYKKNCLQSLSRPPQSFVVRESGFTIAEVLATTVGCNDNYPSMKAESVHERHFVEDRSENEFPFRHRSHVGGESVLIKESHFFIYAGRRRGSHDIGIYGLESFRETQRFHLIREVMLQCAEFRSTCAILLRCDDHLLLLVQAAFLESNRSDHITASREWTNS